MRWWDLVQQGHSQAGEAFNPANLACPYCTSKGAFSRVFRQTQPNESSYGGAIQSDVWKCSNCGNFSFVIWRGDPYNSQLHRFMVAPSTRPDPKNIVVPNELKWPKAVASAYAQARKSLETEAWDAAATMARRAVQAATRAAGAAPGKLYAEIDELKQKGLMTPALAEWAHEIRFVGNDGAHPDDDESVSEADARQVTAFASELAMYLFTMPAQIEQHRNRRKSSGAKDGGES